MSIPSHEKQILDYLKAGRSITPLEALAKFDCLSLRSRISDLRSKGNEIDNIGMTTKSGKRIGRYVLRGGK